MKLIIYLAIVAATLSFLSACYYDKEELLYGNGNTVCADTVGTISYSQKIVPVFQQYCYSCHSGGFPSGNIVMGNYNADKAIAQNGKLMGSINHAAGFAPMPQGSPKLSSCQIAVIKKWIDSGMSNN